MTNKIVRRISSKQFDNEQSSHLLIQKCVEGLVASVEVVTNKDASASTKAVIESTVTLAGNYVEAKASAPVLENQKVIAETHEKIATARKSHAEAEAIELQNILTRITVIKELRKLAEGNEVFFDEGDKSNEDEGN